MATEQPPQGTRWTRDYVYDILRELGIHYLFGVPGTNEIPLIDGCEVPENEVTYVPCLHENIAMGAAMGYARITGKPGVLVLHVTPGAGHSLGNLYNAWKSRVPLVILCGQQQNELVTQEPLLASNVVQIVSQFTKWSHELRSWEEMGMVLQRAFKEAMAPPAGPVFISLPWEFTIRRIGPDDRVRGITQIPSRFTGDPKAVQLAADLLGQAKSPVIVAGDGVGYSGAWEELQQLAELVGAPVYLESLSSMANFPNSDYRWQGELPGDQKEMQARFNLHDVAFLCGYGAQAQVTVFNYADGPLIPDTVQTIYLHNNTWEIGKNRYGEVAVLGDIKATLPELNALIAKNPPAGAGDRNKTLQAYARERAQQWQAYLDQSKDKEPIVAAVVADALSELIEQYGLQKKFVYVNEAISDATTFQYYLPLGEPFAQPTSYYCVEGGSLGWSTPATLGTKIAGAGYQGIEPELVVNAVGDGSALFYPQVWWTAAQHKLPILYIIMNNLEYRTLMQGLLAIEKYYGSDPDYGWKPVSNEPEYLTLQNPDFNFVEIAAAFGVPNGRRVRDPKEVKAALEEGFESVLKKKQPYLLELFTDRNPKSMPPSGALEAGHVQLTQDQDQAPPLDIFYYKEANLL
ncbi:MAG TPA: thiamine pyrophosphate-binding protein [Chloroflexia bacterium]|jgi:benzoylformate decarboxylase